MGVTTGNSTRIRQIANTVINQYFEDNPAGTVTEWEGNWTLGQPDTATQWRTILPPRNAVALGVVATTSNGRKIYYPVTGGQVFDALVVTNVGPGDGTGRTLVQVSWSTTPSGAGFISATSFDTQGGFVANSDNVHPTTSMTAPANALYAAVEVAIIGTAGSRLNSLHWRLTPS